jgi:hypothetical protein
LTLTVSPKVKATANNNIVKRDERLNQAMIDVFSRRAESLLFKDGKTAV